MLGNRVPGVVGELSRKIELRRRIELLPWNSQRGCRDARRQALGPKHCVLLDRHQVWIGLLLQADLELNILPSQCRDHGIAEIIVRWTERETRDRRASF